MTQDMDALWHLFGLGSATSEGYRSQVEGSGHVFAYGYSGPRTDWETLPGVHITSWKAEERTLEPATKENVAQAFEELGITETTWSL